MTSTDNTKRQLKALKNDNMEVISHIKEFTVKTNNNEYVVKIDEEKNTATCACPDYYNRKVECKHIIHCKQISNTKRLDCPYGDKCNRNNLFHMQEYKHPTKKV
ncbi:MAG: hypothetical protein ACXWFC_14030 [Nitrososphaeraceae archaeon]